MAELSPAPRTPGSGRQLLAGLSRVRRQQPAQIAAALRARRRRPLLRERGTLFLIAADHPARGVLKVGSRADAMADRGEFLRRLVVALERPGVDGLLATPDVIEDLALLGVLHDKVVFGSMNRGGLSGSVFELDDRFTAYTAQGIAEAGLDGGKMMVRIDDRDPGTLRTLAGCARAIDELARLRLPAMVEVLAEPRPDLDLTTALMRAVAIVSGLATTSAWTWLKLPVVDDMERLIAATSLPTLLLGGDPGPAAEHTYRRWAEAMRLPQVMGLVAGRTLLYPEHGDVARAVDEAAGIVNGDGAG
ncbi:MAG TPA: hypothetical protein VFD49_20200 [Candidatus Dormibacteraeota bacterium]|nr:hypothetical protein [Candidatus Dormibacteraeota bacterium]